VLLSSGLATDALDGAQEVLMPVVACMQVCMVRNLYVEKGFNPTHFLSHAAFDCGTLGH
jgi:hypothetical protein